MDPPGRTSGKLGLLYAAATDDLKSFRGLRLSLKPRPNGQMLFGKHLKFCL